MDQNISIATGEKVVVKNLTDELPLSIGAPIEIAGEVTLLAEGSDPVAVVSDVISNAAEDGVTLSASPAPYCIDEINLVPGLIETSPIILPDDASVPAVATLPSVANETPGLPKTVSRQARFSSGSTSVSIFAAALSSAQKQTGRRDRQLKTVGSTDFDARSVKNLQISGAVDVQNSKIASSASGESSPQPELHLSSHANQRTTGEASSKSSGQSACVVESISTEASVICLDLIDGTGSSNVASIGVSDGSTENKPQEVDSLSKSLNSAIDDTPCLNNHGSNLIGSDTHQQALQQNGSICSSSDIISKSNVLPAPIAVRQIEATGKKEENDKQREINDHRRSSRYNNLIKNGPGEDSNTRKNHGSGNANNPKKDQIKYGDFPTHAPSVSASGKLQSPRPSNPRGSINESSTGNKYKAIGSSKTDVTRKNQVNQVSSQDNKVNISKPDLSRVANTGSKDLKSQCNELPSKQSQAHHISRTPKKGSNNWADDDSDDDN